MLPLGAIPTARRGHVFERQADSHAHAKPLGMAPGDVRKEAILELRFWIFKKPQSKIGNPKSKIFSDDLPDRVHVLDADQFLVQAAVEVGELVRVEAHLMQDRGVQVFDVEGGLDGD
jgi:hypothetical protein